MGRIPMTPAGHKVIEDEVQHLKTVERPSIIKMIAEARAHGDLSENAEYHAAKVRDLSRAASWIWRTSSPEQRS